MKKAEPSATSPINTREELIYALSEAAEIEHGLTCAYLFTAFSMKKFLHEGIDAVQQNKIRNWKGSILRVAHQEMEHLGLVCNLLNAIGGPQHFSRPNLPQPKEYYRTSADMQLAEFSLETLAAYMAFEKPDITPFDNYNLGPQQIVPAPIGIQYGHTVQELYEAILSGFIYLDKTLGKDLFIGHQGLQVDDTTIQVGFSNREYGVNLTKVTNLPTAQEAIRRIIEQGEGVILTGDRVETANRTLTELYMKFDHAMVQLAAVVIDQANWSSGTQQIAVSAATIDELIGKASVLAKDEASRRILTVTLAGTRPLVEQLAALSRRDYSPEAAAEAGELRRRFYTLATNDAEGAIIFELVDDRNCHYLYFWRLYQDLKAERAADPGFEPARNVADNPMLDQHPEVRRIDRIEIVEFPYTRDVMALFNAGYETMVEMLTIFYSSDGITEAERTLFMNTAFFPFMTMVIRPLGEVLTMLPVKHDEQAPLAVKRAGGSFEYYINDALLPKTKPRWTYLSERLQEMCGLCATLQTSGAESAVKRYLSAENYRELGEQMTTLGTTLQRINQNFRIGMNLK